MASFKYSLEPYRGGRTKHICPNCQKKTFTRYIDIDSLEYLHETVGRCDREVNCSYHFKPSEYLRDNGLKNVVFSASLPSPPSQKIYIPFEILKKSRFGYESNSFVAHLRGLFDSETVSQLIATYHIGTSGSRWPGAAVFWFIDHQHRIHAGQVKLFEGGHTAKYTANDGERKSCTTYIHSILKTKLNPVPDWLESYCAQEKKVDCLFGEHLIKGSSKPFAIVEAPATAVVASVYLPQFTWLACGALSYLTPQRCKILKGKQVALFPDLNGFEKWKEVADRLGFTCSRLLEDFGTETDKANGLDLRDYLERFPVSAFRKTVSNPKQQIVTDTMVETVCGIEIPMHPNGYPLSWTPKDKLSRLQEKNPAVAELIKRFDLLQLN